MKNLLFHSVFLFQSCVFAGVPFCNISEIRDGIPSNSQVLEFKKEQKLEISTSDKAASLSASWDAKNKFYQMSLSVGGKITNGIFELPSQSGFLNFQEAGRNFSAQCRFEFAETSASPIRYVILHKPGPAWLPNVDFRKQPGVQDHIKHYLKLLEDGKLALGGPFLDNSGGMMIPLAGMSLEEIKAFAEIDPAVKSGLLAFEIKPWLIAMEK